MLGLWEECPGGQCDRNSVCKEDRVRPEVREAGETRQA